MRIVLLIEEKKTVARTIRTMLFPNLSPKILKRIHQAGLLTYDICNMPSHFLKNSDFIIASAYSIVYSSGTVTDSHGIPFSFFRRRNLMRITKLVKSKDE